MDATQLVALTARSYAAIGKPQRVLLALSGGADSVALLHTLVRLSRQEGFVLQAAHVHHGLRAEADADAAFVEALCERLHVPLTVDRVQVGQGNMEAAARDARYAALRARASAAGAQVIALAHQADDQAETILMHWMRGAGAKGLAGMQELAHDLWRPLLTVTRQELLDVLNELKEPWREDASNQDAQLVRNALRLQVIPRLRALAPTFDRNVSRAARLMALEDSWADGETHQWLLRHASLHPACLFLLVKPCLDLHPAMRRRAVRALCERAGLVPDMDTTDRVLALLEATSGTVNLPGGGKAVRTKDRLHVVPSAPAVLPLGHLRAEMAGDTLGAAEGIWQVLSQDALAGAVLRRTKPGDVIAPLGMDGTQSMAKYLANRRVDMPFRRNVPVLARGNEVLWAIGVGISGVAAVTGGTRRRVRLTYQGRLPWMLECDDQEGRCDVGACEGAV